MDVDTRLAGSTLFLAQHLSKGSRIWTLDPSREVLSRARTALRAEQLSLNVEFVQGSVYRIDFEDGFFDMVVPVMAPSHERTSVCNM